MNSAQIPSYSGRAPSPASLLDGLDVGGAYVLPSVGRVFFVRGNGTTILNYDDQYSAQALGSVKLWPSVASALASTSANRGDVIVVFPKHTENLAGADALPFKAGVRIVGLGTGASIPTFTFTVAAATVLMNDINCSISGCRFLCAGPAGAVALTVTAPFAMSAAGCSLTNNQFEIGIDADQICATFLTISAADCNFSRNRVETAAVSASITNCIVLGGANNLIMDDNEIKAVVTTVSTGLVTHTSACTNIKVRRNFIDAWLAASTNVINLGAFASTGLIADNILRMNVTTDVTSALVVNAACDITLSGNKVCNLKNTSAIDIGTLTDSS
jgi:hypothetical protein